MKSLFIMTLVLLSAAICEARTAVVEYVYNGASTDTVAILVSETSGFVATIAAGGTVTGAIDTDRNGSVENGNISNGKTYYFSAVAWDVNGNKTAYTTEKQVVVPPGPPLNITTLPAIEINGKTVNISVTVGD